MEIAYFSDVRDPTAHVQSVTWSQLAGVLCSYRAKTHDKKSVSLWAAAVYDPPYRSGANFRAASALVLDVDDRPTAEFDALLWRLEGHALIVHTTHRHGTPGRTRARVVVQLDQPVLARDWPGFAAGVRDWLSPVITLDWACLEDTARHYFLPSCAPGTEGQHAAWAREGEPLETAELIVCAAPPPQAPVHWRPVVVLTLEHLAQHAARQGATAEAARRVLSGQELAPPGFRHHARQSLIFALAVEHGPCEPDDELLAALAASCEYPADRWRADFVRPRMRDKAEARWAQAQAAARADAELQAAMLAGRQPAVGAVPEQPRPLIEVRHEAIHLTIDDGIASLAQQSGLFHRAGELVEIQYDTCGTPSIRPLTLANVWELLARSAAWAVPDKEGNPRLGKPPQDVARAIKEKARFPGVFALRGLVHAPTLSPDGTLLSKLGYHEDSGLYLTQSADLTVPDKPTQADAVTASHTLLELFCDFPLRSEVDRAVLLAMILTRCARRYIEGSTPVFWVDAPQRGTGKTLAAQLACVIATGHEQPTTAANVANDEEVKKALLSWGRAGADCIFFDNSRNGAVFGGPSLDMAVTSGAIADRVLGRSEIVTAELAVTWILTGNNVELGTDLVRRTLRCQLAPNFTPGAHRDFQIPDLRDHVRRHWQRYLSAALTLLRAHHVAGLPRAGASSLPSFETWSQRIGAAVCWVGLPDPCSAQPQLVDDTRSPAESAVVAVLAELAAHHPDGASTSDLLHYDAYARISEPLHLWAHPRAQGMHSATQLGCLLRTGLRQVYEIDKVLLRLASRRAHRGRVWFAERVR